MNTLNYGLIGNCTSAALVSQTGCIEWCCLPYFDSPSVFASILDPHKGGKFGVRVSTDYKINQRYLRRTNVLVTTFSKNRNKFEVIDFMPRYRRESGIYHCPPDIIRYIRHISGKPKVIFNYDPRPAYAKHNVRQEVRAEYIKHVTDKGPYESVYLYSDLPYQQLADQEPVTIVRDCYFLVSYNQKLVELNLDTILLEYEKTRVYWLDWSSNTHRFAYFNDEIIRSALVLKLLAFQKTGAILAAVTTSLPEEIGATRNWDYRYCWLRDASMNIAVLTKLGHFKVAKNFINNSEIMG